MLFNNVIYLINAIRLGLAKIQRAKITLWDRGQAGGFFACHNLDIRKSNLQCIDSPHMIKIAMGQEYINRYKTAISDKSDNLFASIRTRVNNHTFLGTFVLDNVGV